MGGKPRTTSPRDSAQTYPTQRSMPEPAIDFRRISARIINPRFDCPFRNEYSSAISGQKRSVKQWERTISGQSQSLTHRETILTLNS